MIIQLQTQSISTDLLTTIMRFACTSLFNLSIFTFFLMKTLRRFQNWCAVSVYFKFALCMHAETQEPCTMHSIQMCTGGSLVESK